MAKLYFYYSAMNAGKSTLLLQSSYNYRERGMETLILVPALDRRYGEGLATSRNRSLGREFLGNDVQARNATRFCAASELSTTASGPRARKARRNAGSAVLRLPEANR